MSELTNRLVAVRAERERNAETLQKLAARVQELNAYRKLLTDESGRLERAYEGGSVLVDLKVTHCPACDLEVKSTATEINRCYLCRQAIAAPNGSFGTAGRRIQFEAEQLQAELAETQELIGMLEIDLDKHRQQNAALLEEQSRIEESLQPIRSAVAAILPPELALFDMESGRIQEQVRQLQRVRSSLEYREILNAQIETLHRNIAEMEAPIAAERGEIDFQELGDKMADGMNTYLNRINMLKPGSYAQREVRFTFSERGFRVKVGEGRWDKKLGGTMSLYFLLAYHYALLRLTTLPECHYPGLALIDFPAELPDIVDEENFLVTPFVELLSREDMKDAQLIIAGTGFVGLEGVHRLELDQVWK